MTRKRILNATAALTAFVAIVLAGMSFSSQRVRADENDSLASKVALGFQIAPVKLSFNNYPAEYNLVGLGSYLVNEGAVTR
jgi:hypothetical protein